MFEVIAAPAKVPARLPVAKAPVVLDVGAALVPTLAHELTTAVVDPAAPTWMKTVLPAETVTLLPAYEPPPPALPPLCEPPRTPVAPAPMQCIVIDVTPVGTVQLVEPVVEKMTVVATQLRDRSGCDVVRAVKDVPQIGVGRCVGR